MSILGVYARKEELGRILSELETGRAKRGRSADDGGGGAVNTRTGIGKMLY